MKTAPSLLSRIPSGLIYEYRYLDERRDRRPRQHAIESPARVEPTRYAHETSRVTLCWVGFCNRGCGRTLISATTKEHVRSDAYACGLCE